MSQKPTETLIRAWARLMKSQHLALTMVERGLKEAGLPPLIWYDVLLEIERAGGNGLRPYELEHAMLLAQYNLSRLIDRMEREGYLERRECQDDGRGQLIAITEAGKAVRRKMWPVYARGIEAALGRHLSARQIHELDEILGGLIEGQRQNAKR